MATEKQIAANRANAKRSTGPKTAAGKQKSSRNAFRHGLTQSEPADSPSVARLETLVEALAADQPVRSIAAAREFAFAQARLLRIRAIRAEQWAKINFSDDPELVTANLKRLASLDRLERYANTKRRRASKQLDKQ